ncbi:MAG: NAD-dependent epimerase/dehydratase family protein [Clostridiales bacterium]|nr:NAD-dependent epimerase/dehydratase family protein [Clostridiales bacterium]
MRIVEMDITLPPEDCFIQLGSPDVLIHLAWDGLPNYNSLHHFESELPKHYHFLKSLVQAGLPSLVITGTCLEYGMQSGELPETLMTHPRNPYGHAKDALRRHLEFLQATHPFKLAWTRLFYMYGEGQHQSSLYTAFKKSLARGANIFDMSGGEQLRDYLPVTEVADKLVALALSRCDAGIVNLCSGTPVSVRRLVEQWLLENDSAMQLNLGHFPYPNYEPMAFWGDTTKLKQIIGATSAS